MISLNDVSFSYPDLPLLDKINLSIEGKRMTAILGPNGAGKSTLLKLIAGIYGCLQGKIEIDGRDISAQSKREMARKMAYVPQNTHLSFLFSVSEVVGMGRHPYAAFFSNRNREDNRIVEESLAMVGVEKLKHRIYNQLSGGEKQLVMLASALAQEPSVLILDEPGASLDIHNQLQIYQILSDLVASRNMTVVVVTHQVDLALNNADHLIVMDRGRIIAASSVRDVAKSNVIKDVFRINGRAVYDEHIQRWHYLIEGKADG